MAPRTEWTNPTRPNYGPTRPTPTPGAPTQSGPAPQSDYSRQVAEGGIDAYRQARQGRRWGLPAAQDNYQQTGVFGYQAPTVTPDSEMYQQWLSDMTPQYDPTVAYGFGRTADGEYAGFKTQGALQAAIRGSAETRRAQDRERFAVLDEVAGQRLDNYERQYTDAQTNAEDFFADRHMWGNIGKPAGYIGDPDRNTLVYMQQVVEAMNNGTAPPATRAPSPTLPMVLTDRGRELATGSPERFVGVGAGEQFAENELNPWLAEVSTPDMEIQQFAQSGLATPLRQYAMQAGGDYGVDPYIVAGWYDEASAIGDAADRQTLDFLQQTGMTPTDYEQVLNEIEARNAAAINADQDSFDAATEQQTAMLDQAGLELTGGLATTSELAGAVNLPLQEVYDILDSADFQTSQQAIGDALATRDMEQVQATVVDVLDRAAVTDPALLNVLQLIYKDYIPTGFDLYGPR
jgi:hypothetical protein